jgi:cyclophilin family peptidyl-prolyl cis-trans isomerase
MRWIAVALTMALTLAACGGDDAGTASSVDETDEVTDDQGATVTPTSPANSESVGVLPTSDGPDVGTHWHAAYGIYICDGFVDPIQDQTDPEGVHTHGDGIIHIHPFVEESANKNATLGKFMEALSLELTDDGFFSAEGSVEAGLECPDGPAEFKVARWQLFALDDGPVVIDSDIAGTQFVEDLEIYTFAFVSAGTELPLPPSIPNLGSISDVDPGDLPELPPGFAVTAVPPPGAGESVSGETPCPEADGSSLRTTDFAASPPVCIDAGARYTATFVTNFGNVVIELDSAATPETVNNFVVLARYHYYDDTSLFRTAPSIAIIQGGAPHSNDGADVGPGYVIEDEGDGYTYVPGDLAMARTGAPNSASAQFFFSAGPATANLDGSPGNEDGSGRGTYVVFGRTIEGLDVLEEILTLHVDDARLQGGGPSVPVIIDSILIEES